MVYAISNSTIIFINMDVLNKFPNGLMINITMIKIDIAEHIHIFLVESVKIIKLKGDSATI